ncbi:S41 family peptidase [Henriciella aquimarina]|uniref:S41 family peptidase n=1 Tax=Henriciella aquimarina TaxID=545261 RepID=UPI001301B3CA|nr:S41 family peptidase [Henriciella aquimarina]
MKRIAGCTVLALFCTLITAPSLLHPPGPGFPVRYAHADTAAEPSLIQQDVEAACDLVESHYAYYETRAVIWPAACDMARAEAKAVRDEAQPDHLAILERLLDQLYDDHVSLGSNTASSPRLVPSGSDYHLTFVSGVAVVTAVRRGSGAARAGLAVGDIVTALNGEPVLVAATRRIRAAPNLVSRTRLDWAVNAQAAGYRDTRRHLTIRRGQERIALALDAPAPPKAPSPVTAHRMDDNLGYIRFEDSLGEAETVKAFDAALERLRGVDGWIIDLRNTPGGGNTDVAEPVLARFIRGVKAYQRIGPRWEGEKVRRVASRGPWRIRKPVAVLAGRWTGSMGEGMAVGFDGLKRARVFGAPMAGLAGGVEGYDLPSGLTLRLPAYNLLHLDGTDRDDWRPPYAVLADNGDGPDLALEAAKDWLERR